MRCQVPNDSCEQANDDDGDNKAGPTIEVVCGGNASKKDLPEDSEEVHNVVKTGW